MFAALAKERGPAGQEGQKRMLWMVLPAVLVGTILQRISGTGVGLVVAPAFAISLGGSNGVFLTNVTTAVSGFLLTCALWRTVNWSQWAKLCSSALIGTVIGAVVVRVTPGAVLQLVVGSVVLARGGDPSLWTDEELAEPALYLDRLVIGHRLASAPLAGEV